MTAEFSRNNKRICTLRLADNTSYKLVPGLITKMARKYQRFL
jgi:hypothetical protein